MVQRVCTCGSAYAVCTEKLAAHILICIILWVMKTFIVNRSGLKICVVVEGPRKPGKLVFVMHGLGGTKEGGEIRAMATAFLELDYTVVSFDATHSVGESDGEYADATVTNYYNDLEDVIGWASKRSWYGEPFVLAGHSLGGIGTALFAERNPGKVKGLAPIATVVSGKLSVKTYGASREPEELREWRKTGVQAREGRNGAKLMLKWRHMEDREKYDLLPHADRLAMPVLMVVGDRDKRTPVEHQKILFDALPGPKEFHVIEGAGHVFREESERAELRRLVKAWAAKL